MTVDTTRDDERRFPRHPASEYNIVPPPPSRRTDNGDDKETQRPPHSSWTPPATRTASVTDIPALRPRPDDHLSLLSTKKETPTVVKPQVAPASKRSNRAKAGRGSRIKRHDEENNAVSSSTMIRPGAVHVGAIETGSGRPSTVRTSSTTTGQSICRTDSVVVDAGTTMQLEEPQIVAFLARSEDDQQIEAKIVQTVDERFQRKIEEHLRRRMEEGEVIVAAEAKDDDSSTSICGLKKGTVLLLGILLTLLLIIVGGVVGRVRSSTVDIPGFDLGDYLLEELKSLNTTSDEYISLFTDPMSPQSQALAWMRNDTIVMSPGRSKRDVLQRYVLAVLFYATSGPNWDWSEPFLSGDDVCSWNNGTGVHGGYGVYCRLDEESVNELQLFANSLQWTLPWELRLLTNLEIFNLSSNELRGSFPTGLGQLVSLKSLDIRNNQLAHTIPTELGQARSLESLYLGSNHLTGTIPRQLGQLLSLQSLNITSNQLTGTIPTELSQLLSLETLVTYYNQLTGTIPTELGQLLSLTYLSIEYNQLTGTIPTELGELRALGVRLTIGSNELTGTIPTELGQLLSPKWLHVSGNQLTGTIPTELGQLLSLEVLLINDNQLTGTIPSELSAIANLTRFDLYGNALTGSLEQILCVDDRPQPFWIVDCDKVECSCCAC